MRDAPPNTSINRAELPEESANAAALLSAAFVHELNNVLMAVSGNVQLLQMQAEHSRPDPILGRLSEGVTAGSALAAKVSRLASLIEQPFEPLRVEQLLQAFNVATPSEQTYRPNTVIAGSFDQLQAVIAALISKLSRSIHGVLAVHCCEVHGHEIAPDAPGRSIVLRVGGLDELKTYRRVTTKLPSGTSLCVEMAYAVLAAQRHGGHLAASMTGSTLGSLMLVLPISESGSESAAD